MTKQEEIREGIGKIIRHWSPDASRQTDWQPLDGGWSVEADIMLYLHSQGVVLKAERELPKVYDEEHTGGFGLPDWCNEAYRRAGYVAVEPLMGDK